MPEWTGLRAALRYRPWRHLGASDTGFICTQLRGAACPCTFLTQLREANDFPKTPSYDPAAAAVILVYAGVMYVG